MKGLNERVSASKMRKTETNHAIHFENLIPVDIFFFIAADRDGIFQMKSFSMTTMKMTLIAIL